MSAGIEQGDHRHPALAVVAAETDQAQQARESLNTLYDFVPLHQAEIIVALGGDGFLLQTLKSYAGLNLPLYGLNLGSVGFLMNPYRQEGLIDRIEKAHCVHLFPLLMTAHDQQGKSTTALALNEVSLLRQIHQAAKLRISVDGVVRLEELICDGVLLATPAGSTAYNLSAHGPIIPLNGNVLALTPISPFRPRRWRGALLPFNSQIQFDILENSKRPVSAVADTFEVRDVSQVMVHLDNTLRFPVLFDADHGLEERIVREQFSS